MWSEAVSFLDEPYTLSGVTDSMPLKIRKSLLVCDLRLLRMRDACLTRR